MMQSAVTSRVAEAEDKLDTDVSRTTYQRQVDDDDDNDDDLLNDDNNMERLLSRPVFPRRKLDLFEAPEFIQRLSNYQEATVGETVTFSGQYRAFPKPTVKWFKDEEEVTETKRHCLDLSSESIGIVRLVINDVIRRDEGAYKCKVENQEGVASTTGYLSVSDKSSDKTHSLQSRKPAPDRVSTPPYLRPIAEQKSMEEREEKEYQCLPPSPLQEFMDKIRHSAKSMHGPIVYADMEGLYSDDLVIKDFDDNVGEDVFDEEQNNITPSGSPVEDIPLKDVLTLHQDKPRPTDERPKNGPSIQVFDEFISPIVDLKASSSASVSAQTSNEDSAYDSDNQDGQPKTPCDVTVGEKSEGVMLNTNMGSRRLQLVLQRSCAVEVTDLDASTSETQPNLPTAAPDKPGPQKTSENEVIQVEPSPLHSVSIKMNTSQIDYSLQLSGIHQDFVESSDSFADQVFRWIDSPLIQFFIGFVMSATAVSLACDIPPPYLVAAVFLFSLASFQALERCQKTG